MEEDITQQKSTSLLVWLDATIDESKNEDSAHTISKLREIIKDVHTFTDVDECIDFISDLHEIKTFVISSGAFGPMTVPVVQDMPHVYAVYIFCGNKPRHEQWANKWPIVKGVYTDIKPICEALQMAVQKSDKDAIITVNYETTNKNLDKLDPSFMYGQILKEILLTIDFEEKHIKEFTTYWREQCVNNTAELKRIDKFEQEYHEHTPIWWYQSATSLYSILNRALCTMDVDIIIKLGFFLCDLHKQIEKLHNEQFGKDKHSEVLTVYRGQHMNKSDFDKLMQTKGGLISFNNFLSTNKVREVSLMYASSVIENPDMAGVLFVIRIDSSISTTPFANTSNISQFQEEEEILFSMHSIFRIDDIKQIDGSDSLWEVNMTLTSDQDKELQVLTEHLREETCPEASGWYRLCQFLIKMGHFDIAEKIYITLLDQTTDDEEKVSIYHQLGIINTNKGEYAKAITWHEKSLELCKQLVSSNPSDLAYGYNIIAMVYDKLGDYPNALLYHEKALEIYQKTFPTDHPDLATCYNNIGIVYNNMAEYSKAIASHEKALEIREKTLPPNHPDLAISYNNIAFVYYNKNDYTNALSFYQRALDIAQHSLSADHPDIQLYKMSIELTKTKL